MIVVKYEDIKRVDIKENVINTVKLLRIFFAVRMCVCVSVCVWRRSVEVVHRQAQLSAVMFG